jgi:hypothetical protein
MFDKPTFERLERIARQSARRKGIDTRLAIALRTMSTAELRQAAAQDPKAAEVLSSCAESLRVAILWHEAQSEDMREAQARMRAALSDTFPATAEEGQPDAAAHDGE